MKTVFEYTQANVLVIPQALFAMKDVAVISHHQNSAIFHKSLDQDLVDIEFYTNTPCFIYIENGREVLTNRSGTTVELTAGNAIFLPQGLNLHSDFVKETEALKAYLVFFDDDVILDYLSRIRKPAGLERARADYFLAAGSALYSRFFDSLCTELTDPGYLKVKLQELLHLIAWCDEAGDFHTLLHARKRVPAKQNLKRLLDTVDPLQLRVGDLAHLSGRSISSFNRDFKLLYDTTPKKWLQERKLSSARQMLEAAELSVTDVALATGYENVSSFITAFKARYGLTPSKIKTD